MCETDKGNICCFYLLQGLYLLPLLGDFSVLNSISVSSRLRSSQNDSSRNFVISSCFGSYFNIKQETVEDSKAGLLQFDLEIRHSKVKVKATIEINRNCYWLPSGKVKFVPLSIAEILLNHETLAKMLTDGRTDGHHQSIDRKCLKAIRPIK